MMVNEEDAFYSQMAEIMARLKPEGARFVACVWSTTEFGDTVMAAHGPFDDWATCAEWCEQRPDFTARVVPLFEVDEA